MDTINTLYVESNNPQFAVRLPMEFRTFDGVVLYDGNEPISLNTYNGNLVVGDGKLTCLQVEDTELIRIVLSNVEPATFVLKELDDGFAIVKKDDRGNLDVSIADLEARMTTLSKLAGNPEKVYKLNLL